MGEGLFLFSTQWAESHRSSAIRPGGMGGEVTLLGPHLVDTASHKFPETHEGVGGQPEGERIIVRRGGEAFPVLEQHAAGTSLQPSVGCSHYIVWREGAPLPREEMGREEGSEG